MKFAGSGIVVTISTAPLRRWPTGCQSVCREPPEGVHAVESAADPCRVARPHSVGGDGLRSLLAAAPRDMTIFGTVRS